MIKTYLNYKEIGLPLLDKIPEHWDLTKLRFIGDFTSSGIDKNIIEGEHLVKIINYTDVYSNKTKTLGAERDYMIVSCPESKLHQNLVNKGDLIFTPSSETVNEIGFSALVDEELENTAFSYHVLRFVFSSEIDHSYKKYFCNNNYVLNYFSSESTGSTRKILGRNAFKNAFIAIPPRDEQTKIAQYLDKQTATIDQLIQQKEKLIELLKEKRQSVINEAVTKGLYPNAKMKDSGIEWLGEVPKHWKVARIGHYTQLIRGASPRPAGDPRYFGGDFMPWITVGEVTNGDDKFVLSTENYLTKEGSEQSRIIYPETLLLSNSGATLGVPKISKITGCINDGSVAFISLSNQLERDFLFYFFKTHTEIYRQEMSGYGQPNLNTDIIKSTKIPLPPISEQIEIVNFIENEFLEFDKIIFLSALQIDKMKEYRQSIISEAVTGMIDVRDWQPNKQQVA